MRNRKVGGQSYILCAVVPPPELDGLRAAGHVWVTTLQTTKYLRYMSQGLIFRHHHLQLFDFFFCLFHYCWKLINNAGN